ncbi:DnaD domain protein [Streptococcus cuniculipharyngis]|uniref:DnaD domain protein n=1 Tax=Streptococcus cuniculipharyngis TaxID=1562651 RepID=A0A5C5SG94_9STRE|nr:DnaD domain protein [Streptococcus cuniculipharyngis]TWS99163.1 DnaD domain protein [Streptococcus cuniculipharyngis]
MSEIAEVGKYRFVKLFEVMLEHEELLTLSFYARGLHSILYDRLQLARRYEERYQDKDGEFFVEVSAETMCRWLGISKPTLIKVKKELIDAGLLVEKKGGFNKPNRLYPQSLASVVNLTGAEEFGLFDGKDDSQVGVVLESTREHGDALIGDDKGVKNLNGVKKFNDVGKNSLPTGLKNFTTGGKNSLLPEVKNLYPNQTIYQTNHQTINQTYLQTRESVSVGRYYQERVGVLDGVQYEQLMDFVSQDEMSEEVLCLAIDLAADKGKRSFKYLLGILRNWRQAGIKTVGDVMARETERKAQQSSPSAIPTWSQPGYKAKTYDDLLTEVEEIDDDADAF